MCAVITPRLVSPALPVTRGVLLVEDEQNIRDVLTELFDVEGTEVEAVGTLAEAKLALARRTFDLIVTDIRLGGKRDGGLQVMAASGLVSPDATIIALTAYPDLDNREASMRLGATHFQEKPEDLTTLAALAAGAGVASALAPAAAPASPGVSAGVNRGT